MAPSQRRQELITNQKADPYKVCLFLKKGAFPLIQLLIRTFVKNYKSTADRAVRTAYGNLACIVSVVCNLLLAGGKIAVGVLTGSVAITADGMNNLSDASSNIVSLVGFKLGARPADSEHPYGHARYEYLAGLAVSVMILVIGVELLKESFAKVLHPTEVAFSWLMVAVLLASILVKLWMSRLNRQIGTAIDSETLLATAADARNDVITTAAVLAATILTKLTGFVRIDGLMGIGVAAFILYSGAMLVKDTINPLLGAAPDSDLVEHIEKKALSYPGVLGVHDLMIHDYGPGSRLVSFHLEMDAKDDVMRSHDVIDRIEREVGKELNITLVIHMDPVELHDAEVLRLKEKTEHIIKALDSKLSFHDFRLVKTTPVNLIFDLLVPAEYTQKDTDRVLHQLMQLISEMEAGATCVITVDHSFEAPEE